MTELLRVDALSVAYRGARAVDGASLAVPAGAVVAVLGVNGAGKTSLVRAVMGEVPAAGGTVALDGRRLDGLGVAARARLGLGYAPAGRRVFPGMSVADNLDAAARGGRAARAALRREVEALFPALAERAATPAWQLSGGQQQMLAIGRALMTRPRVLVLDEPSLGLAPRAVAGLLASLRSIAARGAGVLLAEQNAEAALAVADRVLVLERGRTVFSGPAAELRGDAARIAALLGLG